MDSYTPYVQLLLALAGPAIVGLVTAVIFLFRELNALKLHIAENYAKQATLVDIQQKVSDTRDIVMEIASKVGVQVRK